MPLQDWDKLPGEPSVAFSWFCRFRDLPIETRTVLAAYRQVRPDARRTNGTLEGYAKKFKWQDRAQSYDGYRDRLRRQAVEENDRREIEELGKNRRQFRSNELRLADMGFRKVEEILRVATFNPKTVDDPEAVPTIRLPANVIVAAATLFRVSSLIGRQALGIREDDDAEDVTPETFKDIFYKTRGQLERVLPDGAMPTMPDDVNQKPQVFLPDANGNGNGYAELIKPTRERP